MFPAAFDRYIEVFGGGGWVLFGKPPDPRCMEVYNDYNSNLANLFFCVKKRTGAFLKELGFLPINSRDEFCVIRNFIEKQEFDTRFYRRSWNWQSGTCRRQPMRRCGKSCRKMQR